LTKITSVKPTKNVKKAKEPAATKTEVPTLLDLIIANSQARKELAMDFFNHKDYSRVVLTPSGEPACPWSVEDRQRLNFEQFFNRKPETLKTRINQLIRGVSQDDHDEGKPYLVIQGVAFIDDYAGNRKEWAFSIGIVTKPVWMKKIGAYSQETGEPIQVTDEIARFIDEKTIPYSKEQVEELSKHFYKVSLIVKTPTGRKVSCKTVEDFTGDYSEVCKRLSPKEA
jgi:hypothetical protein